MENLRCREIFKNQLKFRRPGKCRTKTETRFVIIKPMSQPPLLEVVSIQRKVDILLFPIRSILGNSLLSLA